MLKQTLLQRNSAKSNISNCRCSRLMGMDTLKIVPVADIPLGKDVPLDSLFKVYDVCMQLQRLCEEENGVGISAVQAGIPWKLFLVRFSDGTFGHFLNCYFEPVGDNKILHIEGCLSLRNSKGKLRSFEVERFEQVKISGFRLVQTEDDLDLEELKDYFASGLYAAVFQHEIQHQIQITIDQIGKEIEVNRIL